MKPLLILVDLQNDYLKSPDLRPTLGGVVRGAAELLAFCRGRGLPVAHVWTTVSRQPDTRLPHWKRDNLWLCEKGTAGHAAPPALRPIEGEPIFHKTGYRALSTSDIAALAEKLAIDTAIVAGTKTHACVREFVLDAWQAGLRVLVAEEATASDDPLHAAATRRYLRTRGVEFVSNPELRARLNGQADATDRGRRRISTTVAAASRVARAWAKTPLAERADHVRRLSEALAGEVDRLVPLIAEEIGKPVRFAREECHSSYTMVERIVERAQGVSSAADNGGAYSVKCRPHGAVAVITPWNNPIYIALGKIVPAMLYGNTVVWKPAPEACAISRHLLQCFAEAGWPEGLVSLLEGGACEGEALMNADGIAAVTITGSSAAGFTAQEVCTRRRIPLQAELGGNNAALIWSDANLPEAARLVAAGAFHTAGQRCTANRRVIVHKACREAFLQLLLQETAALIWGDPLQETTDIGPLVSAEHMKRVAAAVERAVSECGAPVLPLGDVPPSVKRYEGRFFPPTVFCCENPASEIVQEETFGPVLVVQTAKDWDQAIGLCNGVRQGLAAAVFTASREIVHKFLDQAEAGILKVNQSTSGAAVDAPFGGWKASAVGVPEHGRFDIEFFTRPQTVYRGFGDLPSH